MFKLEGLPLALESLLGREDHRSPVWIVGGAIRDHLLKRKSHDIDFTTSGDAIALARLAADELGAQVYILDGERGAGRVLYQAPDGRKQTFDFAQLRGSSIEEDLRDRDLTINAMGVRISASEALIDPCGGLQHLRQGLVEICAVDSIQRDPVRALRVIRIATELKFKISPSTINALRAEITVDQISAERLRDELFNILALSDPSPAFQLLLQLDKLHLLFPEEGVGEAKERWKYQDLDSIESGLRGLRHLVAILQLMNPEADLDSAAQATLGLLTWRLGRFRNAIGQYLLEDSSHNRHRRELLLLTTFLHPLLDDSLYSDEASKEPGETVAPLYRQAFEEIGNRLRLSRGEIEWAQSWEEGLVFLKNPRASTANMDLWSHRFYRRSGDAGVGAALSMLAFELARQIEPPAADHWASRLDIVRTLLEAWFEKHDVVVEPQPLIDGHDVMQIIKSTPGPEVGRIIDQVREAQVLGNLASRKQALDFISKEFGTG